MSKITFIRHAEPVSEEPKELSGAGIDACRSFVNKPRVPLVFCSTLARSQQTAAILYPNVESTIVLQDLEEKNDDESVDDFVARVAQALDKVKRIADDKDCVVISHSYFMNVAHQLIYPNDFVIGFKYLEGFEV
jgi:broad specificity phosphatase PhoE